MKTMEERLNKLFGDSEFLKKNTDKETLDEIFTAVSAEIPEITKEELEIYLTAVSKSMSTGEVSEEDLDHVAGGMSWAAAAAMLGLFYKGGYAIGKTIYNLTHRD